MIKLKQTLAAAALLTCSATAWAGAPQPFSDELFLDWNDLRTMLREQGIDFRVGYVSETATNAKGGEKELWRYTDQWTFSTKLDLQKLFGLKQAQFGLVITDRNGRNLSDDAHLGNLQQVQELYGRGQTWRLTELYYDQKYLGGKLDWKIGKFGVGDDFASFSCEFLNLTFCGAQPGNLVGSYWYNWPVSQWATRLKATFSRFGYVEVGAYEVNPGYLETRNALNFGSPSGATGVLVPVEIAWLPNFGGLAGSYKFGGWYNSSTAPDVVDNTAGQPLAIAGGQARMRHGQYGAYINFEQRLTGGGSDTRRGLSVFLNATYADRRTSTLDSQVAIGMLYTGPFKWRPADELGVAVGETHVNPRIADVERIQNAAGSTPIGVQTSEWASEIFYNIHVRGWLDVRPSVQYVVAPGGVSHNTNDLIAGLRLAVNL
jgi:porin